jgi:hypothetical protein
VWGRKARPMQGRELPVLAGILECYRAQAVSLRPESRCDTALFLLFLMLVLFPVFLLLKTDHHFTKTGLRGRWTGGRDKNGRLDQKKMPVFFLLSLFRPGGAL